MPGSKRMGLFLSSLSQMLWFKTGLEDERLMVFNRLLGACLIATRFSCFQKLNNLRREEKDIYIASGYFFFSSHINIKKFKQRFFRVYLHQKRESLIMQVVERRWCSMSTLRTAVQVEIHSTFTLLKFILFYFTLFYPVAICFAFVVHFSKLYKTLLEVL